MDRVEELLGFALKALITFEKIASLSNPTDIERDAAIQRFEYTFETSWKAAQAYLADRELLESASPKGVIRGCFKAGIFDEETAEKFMAIANDRNLTVHTYKEEFAIQLYSRLSSHAILLRRWLTDIQRRTA